MYYIYNYVAYLLINLQVMEKEVFTVLREKLGKDFDSFITNKVIPIVGDITCENLGVSNSDVREEIWREVDIIVNVAATTNFDERYWMIFKVHPIHSPFMLKKIHQSCLV